MTFSREMSGLGSNTWIFPGKCQDVVYYLDISWEMSGCGILPGYFLPNVRISMKSKTVSSSGNNATSMLSSCLFPGFIQVHDMTEA